MLVATCAYYRMLVITKQICEILKGKKKQKENKLDEKAKLYEAKAQAVRDAFYHHPECYDEATEQLEQAVRQAMRLHCLAVWQRSMKSRQ